MNVFSDNAAASIEMFPLISIFIKIHTRKDSLSCLLKYLTLLLGLVS